MSDSGSNAFPSSAKVVVIGAGIVGNCLVGHLSRLGWTDMVQIDKGPLPNPGGSTGHASNFIFPTDHNKEMAFLTIDSQNQYIDAGLNNTCGGIEVAREPQRLEEFKRRMTSAKAWGIEASLVTPAEIKEMVPFINEDILLGGYYTPPSWRGSVADTSRCPTSPRPAAAGSGRPRPSTPGYLAPASQPVRPAGHASEMSCATRSSTRNAEPFLPVILLLVVEEGPDPVPTVQLDITWIISESCCAARRSAARRRCVESCLAQDPSRVRPCPPIG